MLIVTLLMGVAYAVMFRARVYYDASWGRTTIVRRWGIEREIRIDRDLDGRTDARIRYRGADRRIATHDRPSEIWVDSELDGVFDLHWIDGDPPVLEQRLAGGGVTVLRGGDARIPNARLHIRTRDELGLPRQP